MLTELDSLCLNLVTLAGIKENKDVGHWLRMQGRRCVLLLTAGCVGAARL